GEEVHRVEEQDAGLGGADHARALGPEHLPDVAAVGPQQELFAAGEAQAVWRDVLGVDPVVVRVLQRQRSVGGDEGTRIDRAPGRGYADQRRVGGVDVGTVDPGRGRHAGALLASPRRIVL